MLSDLTLRKAIEFAVKTEEAGELFYTKMARRFEGNEEVSKIFTALALDEKAHHETFSRWLAEVPEEPALKSQRERLAVLRAMSMSEFFLGEDGIFKNLEGIETGQDAIRRAYRLEKDTLGYYLAMKEILGASELLDKLIRAEEGHLTAVARYLDNEGD